MSIPLPFPNPSDPAYPNPYFQDNSFVRGDNARGNNQFIWGNLDALALAIQPFSEYFTSELAAKANSIFYNGASLSRGTYEALFTYVTVTRPERTGQDERYATTSTTSKTIAIGPSFSMTVANSGLSYLPGQRVRMWKTSAPVNYVEGVVTSYTGTTLVFTADASGGSGTINAWSFACADKTLFGLGDGSTTFTAPDWRGLAIRGAGASGYYTAANGTPLTAGILGAQQNDQIQGFILDLGATGGSAGVFNSTVATGDTVNGQTLGASSSIQNAARVVTKDFRSDGTNGTPRVGAETHGANVAINFGMFYV